MDLTNSLVVNKTEMVGIVRTELLIAKNLHEIDPSVRFFVLYKYCVKEINVNKLNWLWKAKNLYDSYSAFLSANDNVFNSKITKMQNLYQKLIYKYKRHKRNRIIPRKEFVVHPFKANDVIFSSGLYEEKTKIFGKLRSIVLGIKITNTIFDLAMLHSNVKPGYSYQDFINYIRWIACCSDLIFYGGKTAQNDAEKYFAEKHIAYPAGKAVKWGSDFVQKENLSCNVDEVIKKYNISSPFILAVGAFDFKNNYTVLYRAYAMLAKKFPEGNYPMLVIAGSFDNQKVLYDSFSESLEVKDHVRIIKPTDAELSALYSNCLFTVLPTFYEGWSITLPESFNYGKLCVCSDIAPLKEIAGDLTLYAKPTAPREWVDIISKLYSYPEIVKEFEEKIKKNWKPITWKESSQTIYDELIKLQKEEMVIEIKQEESLEGMSVEPKQEEFSESVPLEEIDTTINRKQAVLYYDLKLLFIYALGGIPKTVYLLARYLYSLRDNVVFFYFTDSDYYEIPPQYIKNLLSDMVLDEAIKCDRKLLCMVNFKKRPCPFTSKDIVLSVGTGFDTNAYKYITKDIHYVQLIYDLTPFTVPQTHADYNINYYNVFFKKASQFAFYMLYGGKTAQKDGERFQKERGYPVVPSTAIKFGSDLISVPATEEKKEKIFTKYGIEDNYLLAVGTIQPRKNYEILYNAYIELLESDVCGSLLPQLVICGVNGWKCDEFVFQIEHDERVKNKIILITPNDEELDVLYQLCQFTLLPSIYEGWSLTLPESLNYQKLCIASYTPSLVEIGENMIEYADPYDPMDWADKISYYVNHPEKVKEKVEGIKKNWHNTTWQECAENVNAIITKLFEEINKR